MKGQGHPNLAFAHAVHGVSVPDFSSGSEDKINMMNADHEDSRNRESNKILLTKTRYVVNRSSHDGNHMLSVPHMIVIIVGLRHCCGEGATAFLLPLRHKAA